MRRFFGEPDPDDPGRLIIQGAEARHAARVLRLKPGDLLIILSGGREYDCAVTAITGQKVTTAIRSERESVQPGVRITLAQGLIKGPAMDDVIRFASELGACSFIPLITGRVVPSLSKSGIEGKLARWRAIAESAAKVAGAAHACHILAPMEIGQLCAMAPSDLRIVFWERERTSLKSILSGAIPPESALLAIGPEGGFTDGEMDEFRASGFISASLGDRIIRAQTAGAAALMAMFYQFGR